MNKMVVAWAAGGLLAAVLLLPAALAAFLAAFGGQATIVQAANELYTTPAELAPLIKEVGPASGHSYAWLAAWIWVNYPDYKLPGLTTRPEIEREMSDVDCEVDKNGKQHCIIHRPSHEVVEQEWRARAKLWLQQLVHAMRSEESEEGLLPYNRRQAMHDVKDSIEAYEQSQLTPTDAAGWDELTTDESYQLQYALREWPYRFPVIGKVTFSDDWHEVRSQNSAFGTVDWHQGTDIMAPEGAPVVAACRCVVKKSGWNKLGGWTIELEDPLYHVIFYYAHLRDDPQLAAGSQVLEASTVAYVGHTGEGEPGHQGGFDPHLHFGIYTERGATNPYPYLRRWQGGPGGAQQNS